MMKEQKWEEGWIKAEGFGDSFWSNKNISELIVMMMAQL